MKKTALLLTMLLAMATAMPAAPGQARTAPPSPQAPASTPDSIGPVSNIRPTPENFRFANGQVLHYTAEWRLWTAGAATLRIDSAGAEQHVSATADSAGFVALLYKVADRFESYFDRKSFCSLRISKHTEEGRHLRDTKIRFDYGRRKAMLDERNLKSGATKHAEEDTPGCVTDVLSGIFYVGSLPLDPGATYTFPLNDGGKTVDVKVHVEAREEVKTDAGTFRTIRVQPEAESGVIKNRGKMWIWYTDDASHTPVQMRARLFWGTLTFKLTSVERQ